MKNHLLLPFLFFCSISFSQTTTKFKTGVELFDLKISENYNIPTSVLFVFEGHTHEIYNFLNLKKQLKKRFKRKAKVQFNFNLSATNPLKEDLKIIPTKKHKKKNFDAICVINISGFKSISRGANIYFSKMNYILNVSVKDFQENKLSSFKLNINCTKTILTQNRKVSTLIYKTLTKK